MISTPKRRARRRRAAESTLDPAPVREPSESILEPAPVQEPSQVTTELPDCAAAAMINKVVFAFHLVVVLHAWPVDYLSISSL